MRVSSTVISLIFFIASIGALFGLSAPTAFGETIEEQRALLQAQLALVQTQIVQNQKQLEDQQKQRTSLERDVAILNSKIQAAQLTIKARDLQIKQLQIGITQKAQGISSLDGKVADGQQALAQILRETQQMDDTTFVELALGGSLTDIFREADNFQNIQSAMKQSFVQIATQRSDLFARKQAQVDQKQEEQDLRQLQVLQQQVLKSTEKQKKDLVATAKGQESVYQKMIATNKKTAAQIEAALFTLRDTKSVSFGDIYSHAREAAIKTGVRPALILGILAEESNLGQNVGTGNWRDDMHPTRDAPVFQQIAATLGINPDTQPVSKKPWYGWGGAMGPAQFIPSTWVQYQDRIAKATGENPANPWNPRTAAFAAAILMADNGADAQTPEAERLAALRYLAGWKNATKPAYAFYGDDVMELTAKFQSQIDVIKG